MDTLTLQRQTLEKTATSAAGIGIALLLLLTQNLWISAKDISIPTGFSPAIGAYRDLQKIQEEIFEDEITQKYKNYKVISVEKGVKHIKMIKYFHNKPVRINIVEISKGVNNKLAVEPAIASERLASRSKISKIAAKENAIVAINGGYFKPQTGTPLGTLMINGKLYTSPIYDRVGMGIFDNHYEMARVQMNAEIKTNKGIVKIDNVNQPRMLATHTILYTKDWGEISPPSPKYGIQIIVKDNKIAGFSEGPCEIPDNGYIIVGPKSRLDILNNAKNAKLNIKFNPEWENVRHIISGGPYLVKNGEIFIDTNEEKLSAITGRNPRTAIGYTKDNNLIMLTADGREGASIGLTLQELAYLMKELGCIYAMNLDGGGSTVMYVNGSVVNKPAVTGGIPLSHTLTIKKLS